VKYKSPLEGAIRESGRDSLRRRLRHLLL